MTTRHSSRALGLSILFIMMVLLGHPALSHFKFLSTENDAYEVELIRWERYGTGYGDVRFGLLVREKKTHEERIVTVENPTTGLEEAAIVDGTLLLFGEVRGRASSVTLVDLEAAKVTDFFLHYRASLSPGRRYLVFKAFYPPYGMRQSRSDVVRIYDLSQDPAKNRLPGTTDSAVGQNVGLPVYPPENVNPPTYLVWVLEESQRHYIDSQAGFLWASDEKSVFFIDKTGDQQLLVRVDVEEGLRQPRITTRPIDVTPAFASDPHSPASSLAGERKLLAVTGMELEPDGRIRLELDRGLFDRNVYRVTHLTVSPPRQERTEEQP